jgi:hypothetical protein
MLHGKHCKILGVGTLYDGQINRMEHRAVCLTVLIFLIIHDLQAEACNNKIVNNNSFRISNISSKIGYPD